VIAMSYGGAISTTLIAGIIAVFATAFSHRLIEFDLRRHHHDVGSVVSMQLGVVFAVLLAFVSTRFGVSTTSRRRRSFWRSALCTVQLSSRQQTWYESNPESTDRFTPTTNVATFV
jgi:hypothetical protein